MKVDAHAIAAAEYKEIPELTEDWFAKATPMIGKQVVSDAALRRKIGRPRSDNPKQAVNLRLDADVVAHFRNLGPGWQTRINAALRKAARLPTKHG